jgi:hypothetical protein
MAITTPDRSASLNTDIDLLTARAQVGLAYFYGVAFLVMFALIVFFWDKLSKIDASIFSMFATGALTQAKEASGFFFARHQSPSSSPSNPTQPPLAAKT